MREEPIWNTGIWRHYLTWGNFDLCDQEASFVRLSLQSLKEQEDKHRRRVRGKDRNRRVDGNMNNIRMKNRSESTLTSRDREGGNYRAMNRVMNTNKDRNRTISRN